MLEAAVDLEARVAAALATGDVDTAATLAIRGYGPQILSYLRAVLRDEAAADDVFSTFAEHLWKGIGSYARQGSFLAWCYAVAWGAVRRHLADPYRRRKRRLPTTRLSKLAEEVRTTTVAYLRTAVKDRVAQLRESLAPDEQTLLILRVDRKLSWREVADVMAEDDDRPDEAALRKRFERIKDKLRKLAAEHGLLES